MTSKAPYKDLNSGHRDGIELGPRGDPGTVMLSIQGCRQEATKDTWQETEADGKKITWVQCLGNQRKKTLQEGSFDEPCQVLLLDQVR